MHIVRQTLGLNMFFVYKQDFDCDMVTFNRRYNIYVKEQCNRKNAYDKYNQVELGKFSSQIVIEQMRWALGKGDIQHWGLGPRRTMRWKGDSPSIIKPILPFPWLEAQVARGKIQTVVVEVRKCMRAEYDEERRTVRKTSQELFGGWEKRKKKSVVYAGGNATDSARGESKAGPLIS